MVKSSYHKKQANRKVRLVIIGLSILVFLLGLNATYQPKIVEKTIDISHLNS